MKYVYLILSFLIMTTAFSQNEVELIPFRKGDLFGYSDRDKNIVIKPQFDNAYPFGYTHGYSYYIYHALTQIDTTMYIVNHKGEIITQKEFRNKFPEEKYRPAQQDRVKTMEYSIFEVDGKQGVKDELGSIIIPAEYDYVKLYLFGEDYYDEKTKKYFTPSYAQVDNQETDKLIRLDKYMEYDNVRCTSFTFNSNHLVISLTLSKGSSQKGIITTGGLFLMDPKYINIWKYYEEQEIMCVSRVLGRHPADMYISLDGVEYYEE